MIRFSLGACALLLLACPALHSAESKQLLRDWRERMQPITPKTYDATHCEITPVIDGRLDDPAWTQAPWTADFVDIEGLAKPLPRFRTRAKMLWSGTGLFIAAELEEPHVLGSLTEHDSVIFNDPDFEVFIDPDGDTHGYYELEINALNTSWDLRLSKAYLDQGKPDNSWSIPGLKTAVAVQGTLNNPKDTDKGWSVEIFLPWNAFPELAHPPAAGTVLRLNFSRVEWQYDLRDGRYEKRPGLREDNWVWSPQGVVDMHRPEMWGLVRLAPRVSETVLRPPPSLPAKAARDLVMDFYSAQHDFQALHGRWARSFAELAWEAPGYAASLEVPTLTLTDEGYLLEVRTRANGVRQSWTIRQDRLLSHRRQP